MNQSWVGGTCPLECLTKAGGAHCAAEAVWCFRFDFISFCRVARQSRQWFKLLLMPKVSLMG